MASPPAERNPNMTPARIASTLRSPRVITPLVVISANFYLPTIGIGTENDPNVPIQASLVAVSLVGAAIALTDGAVRQLINRTPVLFAFILSGLMMATSLQSSQPLDGVARGLWFAAVALVVLWTVAVERWHVAMLVMAAPLALLILASIAAYPFADVEFQRSEFFNERLFPWPRLRGLTANHTVIGLSGALIASVAVSAGRAWWPIVSRLILVCGIVGVLASHSRAAIGALAVGVLVELYRRRRDLVPALLAGTLITAGLLMLADADGSSLGRSERQEGFNEELAEESDLLTGRSDVWLEAWDFAGDRPVTGHGVGVFAAHTGQEFESGIRQWDPVHAHNVLLELLVDQGLLGVVNLLAMMVAVVVLRRHLTPGSVGILVIVGSHSMVEGLFYGAPTFGWFMLVAVLAGVAESDRQAGLDGSLDRSETQAGHAEHDEADRGQAQLGSAPGRR